MPDIWFASDTHFGHELILTFKDKDGRPVRRFNSIEEHDELIIDRWNKAIRPTDKVYHLGDVAMGQKERWPALLARLNGKKRLVIGNHDPFQDTRLTDAFEKVVFWRKLADFGILASHVPMREDQFRKKFKLNVHGHIHEEPAISPHHLCVCMEQTDYHPISLDEIKTIMKARGL